MDSKGKGGESWVSAAIPSCSLIGCEVTALLHHTSPSLGTDSSESVSWSRWSGFEARQTLSLQPTRRQDPRKDIRKKNAEPLKGGSEHKGWRSWGYCQGRHTEVISVNDTRSTRWMLNMADSWPAFTWLLGDFRVLCSVVLEPACVD